MPKTRNCTVRPREETGASNEDLVRKAESVRKQANQWSRDHPEQSSFERIAAIANLRLSDDANSVAVEAILLGGAPQPEASHLRPKHDRGDGKDHLQGRPLLTADGSIPRAGKPGAMAPPEAPLPGPAASRKMLSIADMLCDTTAEKHVPKKPAGSDNHRKGSTQRDSIPPLTREELGKLEFQEGTAVMVKTLRFDGSGHGPRLRRGTIAPFAKYPPSLERSRYPASGKLCHRYMVIMDDTREVMGPFCTALGEILPASGLMSAKLDAA